MDMSNKDTTKNEVFAAYEELLGKLKANKKVTLANVDKREEKIVVEPVTPIEDKIKPIHTATIAVTSANTVTPIANAVPAHEEKATMQFAELHQFLMNLENKLSLELEYKFGEAQARLTKTQAALEICTKELDELYNIRVNADTLAALLLAQKEKAAAFEQEMEQKRKMWQQEEKDYTYKRDLIREKELNEFETARRNLEQRERLLQEEIQRIVEIERQRLDQEISLKYEYQTKLAQAEMDGERRLLKQTITTLEAKVAHLESLKYSFNKLTFNANEVETFADA